MSKKKAINSRKLIRLIDKDGLNQSQAAKELGVTRQAVSQKLQEIRGRATKAVAITATKKIDAVIDEKIDAFAQLKQINVHANELLELCMAWQRGDDVAIQVLESQKTVKRVRVGGEEIAVDEFKFKDPRELALKAMAEIRGQLKLQLEIFQSLYDVQAAAEFQEEVLRAIEEVAPDVRKRIISKLNQRRAIRSAVRFSESNIR